MPLAFSIAVLLIVPAATLALPTTATHEDPRQPRADDVYAPAYDAAWADAAEHGLRWSTVNQDTLVAPLVAGAGLAGWTDATLRTYEEGQGWAQARLATADRVALEHAINAVLDSASPLSISLDSPTRVADVAEPFVAPLATLLDAQARLAEEAGEAPALDTGPWGASRQLVLRGAWTLGVTDAVLPALHAAAPAAPETPLPLDPAGLIILGGLGDDHYTARSIGPLTWAGPILLVEPAGNDTYDVPIAARSVLGTPTLPVTGWTSFTSDPGAIGLELAGNDTYRAKTAAALQSPIAPHVLVDEAGDDAYGHLDNGRSLAAAIPGFAFLGDRAGDDTYQVKDRGLAFAWSLGLEQESAAVAVLSDWEGDDVYEGRIGSDSVSVQGETHARSLNIGGFAFLRDFGGNDTYIANHLSFAVANDDGTALFLEDDGNDSYFEDLYGGEFGDKALGERGLPSAPLQRSLAYFLDARGVDRYEWRTSCCQAEPIENQQILVETGEEERWGIFVDCTSGQDGVPCPREQQEVLRRIVESET